MDEDDLRTVGMRTRREVLGDEHVDRVTAATTPFSANFQDFITRYAWGEVWGNGTLDRRTRRFVAISLLAVLGHEEELAMHIRMARGDGVTDAEISETLQLIAPHAGVAAAEAAARVAQAVFDEDAQ